MNDLQYMKHNVSTAVTKWQGHLLTSTADPRPPLLWPALTHCRRSPYTHTCTQGVGPATLCVCTHRKLILIISVKQVPWAQHTRPHVLVHASCMFSTTPPSLHTMYINMYYDTPLYVPLYIHVHICTCIYRNSVPLANHKQCKDSAGSCQTADRLASCPSPI